MTDPIVEEVRKARDEYAARFNYDLDAIVADLRKQEKQSGRKLVNFGRRDHETAAAETARQPNQTASSSVPPVDAATKRS